MGKLVIYNFNDSLAILIPSPRCMETRTIEEIANKDVPAGTPYKIIDESELPSDDTFRNAWEAPDELLTDGVGDEVQLWRDDPNHPLYVPPIEGDAE